MRYLLPYFFLFLIITDAHAQTACTGGLGDPIVHISFGSGAGIGSPLGAGITNLKYIKDECPSDGYYSIVNSCTGCWGNTWHSIRSDHTGDPNGYFMVINASYDPSDFYVQTVDGLCESTTYQFAAWVMNIVSYGGELPSNITFSIEKTDGTVLQSTQTGDIATVYPAKWNQYAFYFTTPPGISSVVIRMKNNAPGGIGNDLALDDITFRTAGPSIGVHIDNFNTDTATVCPQDPGSLQLRADVESCYANTVYQWQLSMDSGLSWTNIPGATGLSYSRSPTTAGFYLYRMTVAQSTANLGILSCRIASDPVAVVVNRIPEPAVTISLLPAITCEGAPAVFTAKPVDGGTLPAYQWELNGSPVGPNSDSYTTVSLADGDNVQCRMTSNAACVIAAEAISNPIAARVIPHVNASVRILASATTICSDSGVLFVAIPSNGGNHPQYHWMVNGLDAGSDIAAYSSSTLKDGDLIDCRMTGSLVCSDPVLSDNPVKMTVYPLPSIVLTPDTIIEAGHTVHLTPIISGVIDHFTWSPVTGLDDPLSPDPVALPAVNTTYQLDVVSDKGCTASAREVVGVFYYLAMPNAFSPNGDGVNDLFRVPPSVPLHFLHMSVYNRWGLRVFTGTAAGDGWDGRWNDHLQPPGTYIWEVQYRDLATGKTVVKKGTVVLIR